MANFRKIKQLAKERGISLGKLAQEAGITSPGLSLIMSSNVTMTTTIEKIAKILDINVGYFFDEDSVSSDGVIIQQNIMEILYRKDEEIRKKDERIRELTDLLIKKQ